MALYITCVKWIQLKIKDFQWNLMSELIFSFYPHGQFQFSSAIERLL
jgi:hypothetical protein